MKLFPFLVCSAAAVTSFRVASAAPQPVQELQQVTVPVRQKVPVDVAARLPAGAVTLHLGVLPIGPRGASCLVHIWSAERHSAPGGNFALEASPVCVDVFEATGGGHFTRTALDASLLAAGRKERSGVATEENVAATMVLGVVA